MDNIFVNSYGKASRNEENLDDIMNISRIEHKHSKMSRPRKDVPKLVKNQHTQSKSGASEAHDTLTRTYCNDAPEAVMRRSKSIALQTVLTFDKKSKDEDFSTRTMNSENDGKEEDEPPDEMIAPEVTIPARIVANYGKVVDA